MRKKNTLGLLLVVSFFLAACTPPNPSNRRLDNIESDDPTATEVPKSIFDVIRDRGQGKTEQKAVPPATKQNSKQPPATLTPGGNMKSLEDFEQIEATQVTLVTTQGDITFEIYKDQVPLTTANFLNLAKDRFYDGVVFHRVIDDFMIQVGDPLSKDESKKAQWGSGDPGYKIPDEFVDELKHDGPGVVSMANSGPNTGGSQFFITHVATSWLDGKHTVFGKVTEGMDVVNKIQVGDKILSVSYE